ncbi:MAG TPA: cytidine deaminase [Planctomycetaceae bacterium]|nr:cytidine deaminase [Planctomycetaceae bacterium]HRF00103.1 cytidine deaminase [Pirellulaceae bacterium]
MSNSAPQSIEPSGIAPDRIEATIAAALAAREAAYAPYSGFPVGAALLSVDGRIIAGCNVENASYSLTQCAERTAVQRAIVERVDRWILLAIASRGGVSPCGACRQVLVEFTERLPIVLIDVAHPEQRRWLDLDALLPERFSNRALS